jgi:hypothetical protein
VANWQTRSDVEVGGTVSNWSEEQIVSAEHTRSEVAEGGMVSYVPAAFEHCVKVVQVRSEVDVGETDWYSVAWQLVKSWQTRLVVGVGKIPTNCVAVQTVNSVQTLSEVADAALDSYWVLELQVDSKEHTRSEVSVAALDSYETEVSHSVKDAHWASAKVEQGCAVYWVVTLHTVHLTQLVLVTVPHGLKTYETEGQIEQLRQTVFVVELQRVAANWSPATHWVHRAQTVSVVFVQAAVMWSLDAQDEQAWQIRFEVVVGAVTWNCDAVQTIIEAHTRFEVAVGAWVWYCVAVHDVRAEHTRSEVAVGALDWYWVDKHVVRAEQTVLEVRVQLELAYSLDELHALQLVHTEFWRLEQVRVWKEVPNTHVSQALQTVLEKVYVPDAVSVEEQLLDLYWFVEHVAQAVQATSVNAVPALVIKEPDGQVLYGVHTASDVKEQFRE